MLETVPTQLFIGGRWRAAASGKTVAVLDPATGGPLCDVADGDVEDGLAALDAAAGAQAEWASTPPRERGEILRRTYDRMVARREEFALLITLEMGKPIADSRGEVDYAADFLRWYSEEAVRIDGRYSRAPDGRRRILTLLQPVGPCLLITPWNFPLALATRKVGPALAAGCTIVLKPSEEAPLSCLALAKLLEESGLPAGVLNLVTTTAPGPMSSAIVGDGRVRKVSFTGSTQVGMLLMSQCSQQLLRVSMELGGNAPFLVFEDADLDAAVEGAVLAKMRNMGEACTAANRFHVAAPIAEEFSARLADRLRRMKVGRGTEPGVEVGPLINPKAVAKVRGLVDDARDKGARVLLGGHSLERAGFFYAPTVLASLPGNAKLLREEIFGPVAPVIPFESEAEAIAAANATEFGLLAYLFTRDLGRALRVIEALETGMVGVNQGLVSTASAPFGGVKHSGFGREGGKEGMHEYLNIKYAALPP